MRKLGNFAKIPSDTFRRDIDSRVMAKSGENLLLGSCRKVVLVTKNSDFAGVMRDHFAPTSPIAPKIS